MASRRVFRTRTFSRWSRRIGLSDDALCEAIEEMARAAIDADLGGHVVKKRVAIQGHGKRGGARTLIATRLADRWFFVYGFRKNERENVTEPELKALQGLAKAQLGKKGPGEFTILPGLIKAQVKVKPAIKAGKWFNPFTKREEIRNAKPARRTVRLRALKGLKAVL